MAGGIDSLEFIPGLLKRFKIPALVSFFLSDFKVEDLHVVARSEGA
jgi:hypothetical protein